MGRGTKTSSSSFSLLSLLSVSSSLLPPPPLRHLSLTKISLPCLSASLSTNVPTYHTSSLYFAPMPLPCLLYHYLCLPYLCYCIFSPLLASSTHTPSVMSSLTFFPFSLLLSLLCLSPLCLHLFYLSSLSSSILKGLGMGMGR